MNLSDLASLLANPSTPWLPSPALTPWALHAAWAVVAGALTSSLLLHHRPIWHRALTAVIMLWLMLPGSASPAYWLGLAFQMPSLMSVVVCLMVLWQNHANRASFRFDAAPADWQWGSLGCILLGWVLLLDALALTPFSIYAWGFQPAALCAVMLLLLLIWAMWGGTDTSRHIPLTLTTVLAVFVVTRLPSGNLWDALLDPWLWLLLQSHWLRTLGQRLLTVWREPVTIRAEKAIHADTRHWTA